VWTHINSGFASGLGEGARGRFEQGLAQFQQAVGEEIDRTARAIYDELEKNPVALNTLRGTKFALEVASITGAVLTAGQSWMLDIVLVPLAASISHHLVELLGKQYVDSQREQARARQQALVLELISGPLAEWLAQWPTTGGSAYERLQLALRRIPADLKRLDEAVSQAMQQG
jgi:hypothetical protein